MSENIKLAFVGDVMCGDSFSLMGKGAATMIDRYGKDFLSDEIVNVLKSHDMVMGNIECVLSNVGRNEHSLRQMHMRGRANTAKLLSEWGFTVANVANNHILEQGRDAALDTIVNLQQAGIQVIGAGANNAMNPGLEIVNLDIKGLRFCLLGICLRQEKYAYDGGIDVAEALQQVRTCRQESDVVVASAHWGDELIEYPGLQQRKLAEQFKQAGVDVIMGHHPHVFQGLDQVDSMLAAYSLGNFIFDGFATATGWSIILSVTVKADRTLSYEAIPIIRGVDFRPQLADGAKKAELLDEIEKRSQLCRMTIENEDVFLQQYNERIKTLCQNSRKALWKSLAKRFFSFKPIFWPQLLLRPIRRRMGTW